MNNSSAALRALDGAGMNLELHPLISQSPPQGLLDALWNHLLLSANLMSIWFPCIKSFFLSQPILYSAAQLIF